MAASFEERDPGQECAQDTLSTRCMEVHQTHTGLPPVPKWGAQADVGEK